MTGRTCCRWRDLGLWNILLVAVALLVSACGVSHTTNSSTPGFSYFSSSIPYVHFTFEYPEYWQNVAFTPFVGKGEADLAEFRFSGPDSGPGVPSLAVTFWSSRTEADPPAALKAQALPPIATDMESEILADNEIKLNMVKALNLEFTVTALLVAPTCGSPPCTQSRRYRYLFAQRDTMTYRVAFAWPAEHWDQPVVDHLLDTWRWR